MRENQIPGHVNTADGVSLFSTEICSKNFEKGL